MELFHVTNRGVDGRTLFLDEKDFVRFVHDLYEFNDRVNVTNLPHRIKKHLQNASPVEERERIVEIHGWCLMKDHYHLLLSELVEGGLSLFLRKLNIGYAKYYNEKYRRAGTLFQGRTRKTLVAREAYFLYVLHYIHLNPLDYLNGAEKWRERSKSGIRSARSALAFLEGYRWSSYLDYAGKKNFPSIVTTDLFCEAHKEYAEALAAYLAGTEANPSSIRLEY